MQFLLIFSGIVFVLRGAKACVITVSNLVSVHIGSAYAVGQIAGEAVVALGLLAAGAAFIMLARSKHGNTPSIKPSA
jgi:hypothetical protein